MGEGSVFQQKYLDPLASWNGNILYLRSLCNWVEHLHAPICVHIDTAS